MMTRQQGRVTISSMPAVEPATWHVTITSMRGLDGPPALVSATIENDAEALGVDLRFDSHRCVARFFVRGGTLRAATDTAFDRWDLIRLQLHIPDWGSSSIAVDCAAVAADGRRPTARHDHRYVTHDGRVGTPGPRFPYHLWSPG